MNHLFGGYMIGTLAAGVFMLAFARQCSKIVYINPLIWIPPMLGLAVWAVLASRYYNTVWEDISVLVACGILGLICKNWKFSRPALLMSYILFPRMEEGYLQLTGIFFWDDFDAIADWWYKGDTTAQSSGKRTAHSCPPTTINSACSTANGSCVLPSVLLGRRSMAQMASSKSAGCTTMHWLVERILNLATAADAPLHARASVR